MFPPGTRGRARGLPYTMDAFMLGMGMLGESGRGSLGTPQSHHALGAPEAWAPNWVTYQLGKLPFWVSDDKPLCEVVVTITEIGRLIDNHLVPCLAHGGTSYYFLSFPLPSKGEKGGPLPHASLLDRVFRKTQGLLAGFPMWAEATFSKIWKRRSNEGGL